MSKLYVLDTSVTKEAIEVLATERGRFVLLESVYEEIFRYRDDALKESIQTWKENGLLEVRKDEFSHLPYIDDRLIQLCKELQENEQPIELLSNDLLVHLKAQYNGICAVVS